MTPTLHQSQSWVYPAKEKRKEKITSITQLVIVCISVFSFVGHRDAQRTLIASNVKLYFV